MSCKPKAKSLRASNGVELMNRFAKNQPVIHAEGGGEFGQPMNKVPMGAQDQGAFNNIQSTPGGAATPGAATTEPPPKTGTQVDPASLLGAGSWQNIAMPQLKHGGEIHAAEGFFGSLRDYFGGQKNVTAKRMATAEGTQQPAPPPPPPVNPRVTAENPAGIQFKHGGGTLRTGHGGVVPGTGKGDKIAAKYEPGEFVVSNAMLDAKPSLRGELRQLRKTVLAKKGMTPAMADAKAVSGKGLRAKDAWAPENPRFADGPVSNRGTMAMAAVEEQRNAQQALSSQQGSARQAAYAQDAAAKATAEADAVRAGLNKASPAGAPAPTATAAPTPAAPPAPDTRSFLRKGGDGIKSGYEAVKGYGGKAVSVAKSVGPAIVAGAGGYGAVKLAENYGNPANGPQGNYQPPASASQIPTDGYQAAPAAQPYNFFSDTDTGRNLNNLSRALPGAVGGGVVSGALRVGSGLARTASTAEGLGLATAGGAQAAMPGTQVRSTVPGAAQTPAPDTYPQANANSDARQLRLGDPSSSDLNDEFSNAMIENRNPNGKVTKVVGPDGKVSYSGGNVSGEVSFQGADGNALRGRPGGGYVSTPDDGGASLAAARASLRNPDGSQWSASDNAIMAANLRDGVDKYRGTSRGTQGGGADKYANMPIKMATAMRVADAQAAAQMATTNATNENLRTIHREDRASAERVGMMPYKAAQAQRDNLAAVLRGGADGKGGGAMNLDSVIANMAANGMPIEEAEKLRASQNASKKSSEELEAGKAKRMSEMFKGDFGHLPKEEREYAEGLAAQTLSKFANGEILGATEGQDMRQQALLHTKALLAMQAKTKLRNGGLWNWIGGDDSMPTSLDGSATPKLAGSFGWNGGMRKGHNFVAGDYNYGDQELPADVGDDVIDYLTRYNKTHSAAQQKAK